MFPVMVDAHSKWLELHIMQSATSLMTIEKMRSMFTTHGLPEMVMIDNGTVFTSDEFKKFMDKNGIRHVHTSPYHPASNGLTERAVQTFRIAMKKVCLGTIESRLSWCLFKSRTTLHSPVGHPPAELLMGRTLRSHLDLVHPDVGHHVRCSQERQKAGHDAHSKQCSFQVGDKVYGRHFISDRSMDMASWKDSGDMRAFVLVELQDGHVCRNHTDHLWACATTTEVQEPERPDVDPSDLLQSSLLENHPKDHSVPQLCRSG